MLVKQSHKNDTGIFCLPLSTNNYCGGTIYPYTPQIAYITWIAYIPQMAAITVFNISITKRPVTRELYPAPISAALRPLKLRGLCSYPFGIH